MIEKSYPKLFGFMHLLIESSLDFTQIELAPNSYVALEDEWTSYLKERYPDDDRQIMTASKDAPLPNFMVKGVIVTERAK